MNIVNVVNVINNNGRGGARAFPALKKVDFVKRTSATLLESRGSLFSYGAILLRKSPTYVITDLVIVAQTGIRYPTGAVSCHEPLQAGRSRYGRGAVLTVLPDELREPRVVMNEAHEWPHLRNAGAFSAHCTFDQ